MCMSIVFGYVCEGVWGMWVCVREYVSMVCGYVHVNGTWGEGMGIRYVGMCENMVYENRVSV